MDHLITPIMVDGDLKCIKHGKTAFDASPYRTESVITPAGSGVLGTDGEACLVSTENADLWSWGRNSYVDILFGFCCFWKIKLRFTFLDSENECGVWVWLNKDTLIEQLIGQHVTWEGGVYNGDPWEIEIDMNEEGVMGRACGSIISVTGGADDEGYAGEKMRMEVVSVTLGPPA